MAAKEAEVTMRDGQVEFRVFVYRDSEPVGTIEGMVSVEDNRLLELAFTDAISERTTKMPVNAVKEPPR